MRINKKCITKQYKFEQFDFLSFPEAIKFFKKEIPDNLHSQIKVENMIVTLDRPKWITQNIHCFILTIDIQLESKAD